MGNVNFVFCGTVDDHRIVIINGISFHVPESQIQKMMSGTISTNPNDPLTKMPNMDKFCGTLVPTGSFKFTMTKDELVEAQNAYNHRLKIDLE
jgi:hypothetical protein